jgi:hypothetical protein
MERINKDYISNVRYLDSGKLKPVPGAKFMQALDDTYGTQQVQKAVSWFFSSETSAKYKKGMKEFQGRLINGMTNLGNLSVDDQKYLANVVHGVALGIFSVTK